MLYSRDLPNSGTCPKIDIQKEHPENTPILKATPNNTICWVRCMSLIEFLQTIAAYQIIMSIIDFYQAIWYALPNQI